jgi:hypothetical protein
MKKIKCNIIICGPAVGKTYLAEQDSRFVDIDGMKADYKYNLYNVSIEEKEKGKSNRGEVVNFDSSKYAIELLKKTIRENRVALLSYNQQIIDFILENKYEYCLVFADKDLQNEYAERMRKRGNNILFIDKMTNQKNWDEFYDQNINDKKPTYKIILKAGQYLSDIKDMFI